MEPNSPSSSADDDRADRLMLLINAPQSDHEDWPLVRRSLRAISKPLERLLEVESEVAWLSSEVPILAKSDSEAEAIKGRLLPPRGYISERPIFAALVAQPHDEVPPELLRTLQSFLLVASALLEHHVLGRADNPPVQRAGLAVRTVAKSSLSTELVDGIGEVAGLSDLCERVEAWLTPPTEESSSPPPVRLTDRDKRILRYLRPLLFYANGKRNPPDRTPGGRRLTQIERVDSDDDDRGGSERSALVLVSRLDDATASERREESLPPVDESDSRAAYAEYGSTRNSQYAGDELTERQANRRVVLKARGFKTSQQWTPNRTEILHSPALRALLASPQARDRKSMLRWEMLALMLFTGCTLDAIQKFRVWADPGDFFEDPDGLGIIAENGMLVMPSYPLPQSWQPDKALAKYFERPDHQIEQYYRCPKRQILLDFPSYFEVGERLLHRARSRGTSRLFPGLREEHLELAKVALKDHIKVINAESHSTLTLLRISRHLANSVYALNGDFAEALHLSHQHGTSNDPRLYYFAPSISHLAQQYNRVWTPLAQVVNGSPPSRGDFGFFEDHIGSAAVPLTPRIRSDVVTMVSRVSGHMAIKGRRSRESWWLVHNILTAYVIRQIQWMTGIRAVRDPIELQNYDPRTGFLFINDKDSADKYGARVVWLLPPIQRQVQVYLQQADMAAKAWSKGPGDLALRFFEQDGEVLETSLSTLDRFTAIGYPYAPNAHRHYQRTRLRELGVDAGYVDAWLGHGGLGREPYARHSSMTPQAVRLALEPALNTIWEELAWQVLPNNH